MLARRERTRRCRSALPDAAGTPWFGGRYLHGPRGALVATGHRGCIRSIPAIPRFTLGSAGDLIAREVGRDRGGQRTPVTRFEYWVNGARSDGGLFPSGSP